MVLPQIAPTTAPPAPPVVRLAQRPVERKRVIPRKAFAPDRAWPPPQGQWTYADWLRLHEDGWRYEVIKGELYMTPGPSTQHQGVCLNLTLAFAAFVNRRLAGKLFFAPIDVYLPVQETPVQPDLLFVSAERASIISERGIEGAPDLVVEIASPNTWWKDMRVKLPLYQESSVREYWMIDITTKIVHVLTLRGLHYATLGQWGSGQTVASEVLDGFEIAVDAIFAV